MAYPEIHYEIWDNIGYYTTGKCSTLYGAICNLDRDNRIEDWKVMHLRTYTYFYGVSLLPSIRSYLLSDFCLVNEAIHHTILRLLPRKNLVNWRQEGF